MCTNSRAVIFLVQYTYQTLDIYADSRKSLEQVITILNHTSSQDTNQDNTCNIVKNEYHNVGVVVNGDNNTVANNNSAVANNNSSIADNGSSVNDSSQKESTLKRWIESIAQNLTASLIWKLIPFIGIIIAYIVFKNSFLSFCSFSDQNIDQINR